jgi:hypothetical protein
MALQRFHEGFHLGRPLWGKLGNLQAARDVWYTCLYRTFSLLQLSARSGLWSSAKCCKKRFGVKEAVGAFGDTLLDLQLYSPVPGLTEEAFAKCKALLRKVAATKEAFWTTTRELRI